MSLDNSILRSSVSEDLDYKSESGVSCSRLVFSVDNKISTRDIIELVSDALEIDKQVSANWNEDSVLYGKVPELDSMSVMAVLAAIEQKYSVQIEHHDVELDAFDSIGSLKSFVTSLV